MTLKYKKYWEAIAYGYGASVDFIFFLIRDLPKKYNTANTIRQMVACKKLSFTINYVDGNFNP